MSRRHEEICEMVIMDWSKSRRGRLFKNPQGTAWLGKPLQTNKKDTIALKYPQKITFGLHKGSSDLIGWEIKEFSDCCTFDVPVFCSVEIKTFAHPDLSEEQINWLNNMDIIGGRGYVARETKTGYKLEEWKC